MNDTERMERKERTVLRFHSSLSVLSVSFSFFLFLSVGARRAAAIELSLEENRAQKGSIGYVDMQKIFKTFPGTVRAKEAFETNVAAAEDKINEKKARILRLRHKIAELKAQKDFVENTPLVISTPTAAAPAPLPAPTPQVQPTAPGQPVMPALPGLAPALSTATVAAAAISTAIVSTPIAAQIAPSTAAAPAPVALSTVTAASPPSFNVPAGPPAPSTAPPALSLPPAISASSAAAAAIDAQVAELNRQLDGLNADYEKTEGTTEKDLLDLESRKTQIILGQIYEAIRAVAAQEKVSVVVDKSSIIFGMDAVDLTQKVMDYLKEHP